MCIGMRRHIAANDIRGLPPLYPQYRYAAGLVVQNVLHAYGRYGTRSIGLATRSFLNRGDVRPLGECSHAFPGT